MLGSDEALYCLPGVYRTFILRQRPLAEQGSVDLVCAGAAGAPHKHALLRLAPLKGGTWPDAKFPTDFCRHRDLTLRRDSRVNCCHERKVPR